jgi:predicted nicotinamide N-methyase
MAPQNTNPDTTDCSQHECPFTVSQLVAAMASENDILDRTTGASEEEQTSFADTIQQYWEAGPSKRFLCSLVRNYIRQLGEHNVQSEALWNLLLLALQQRHSEIPDPHQSCYVTFSIPTQQQKQLTVRIYPYHNDVALRIWEAGAVLAEFLLQHPEWVAHQTVVELGAGVGLTSLVAAACSASHVYCTDFTEVCLQNLQHNIERNQLDCTISCGYLEWEAFGNYQEASDPRLQESCEKIAQANLLIAADVVYDVCAIPSLVKTFQRFFSDSDKDDDSKTILLASIMRRRETFAVLQDELKAKGIDCNVVVDGDYCAELPLVFPMNFVQPRKDVNIYVLKIGKG